jgi:metal-sulfur cluster biosynthetic enzyme
MCPDGTGVSGAVRVDRVLAALATVRDPELDEPITTLGFVESVEAGEARVEVSLRLPTYFCAPNFAWLMVADAKAAVGRVAGGPDRVTVRLVDHFAADTINRGVEAGGGFQGAFGAEADGELDDLRAIFQRKAYTIRQERLCRLLLDAGRTPGELARMTLAELPAGAETDQYLRRRAELGLDLAGSAPFLLAADGGAVAAEVLAEHLRTARLTRVSIEGNAAFCTGMLRTRYGLPHGVEPLPEPTVRTRDQVQEVVR